jgi:hypothetical protein
MHIILSPELEKRIARKVARGDVDSADALVEYALTVYLDSEGGDMDQGEIRESQSAIEQALEQARHGEGRPAEEVFSDLRAKYDISR